MEIKIDTKKDSPEDIRRAIRLLQNLIGDSHSGSCSSEPSGIETTEEVASGMAGIFGDSTPSVESSESTDDKNDDQDNDGVELMTY